MGRNKTKRVRKTETPTPTAGHPGLFGAKGFSRHGERVTGTSLETYFPRSERDGFATVARAEATTGACYQEYATALVYLSFHTRLYVQPQRTTLPYMLVTEKKRTPSGSLPISSSPRRLSRVFCPTASVSLLLSFPYPRTLPPATRKNPPPGFPVSVKSRSQGSHCPLSVS
jgi:hypothetical protein